MTGKKENIVVLLLAFAVFAAGVWALYREPSPGRSYVLAGSFVLLGLIALRQTWMKWRRKK